MFLYVREIIQGANIALILAFALLALFQCLAGYKFYRIWGMIVGFVAGFLFSYAILSYFTITPEFLPALIAAVCGIALAALAFFVQNLGLFIYCGALADIMLLLLLPIPGSLIWSVVAIALGSVIFVLIGMFSVKYKRHMIIMTTAVAGAISAISLFLMKYEFVGAPVWIVPAVMAGFAVAGILIQYLTTIKERKLELEKIENKRLRRENRVNRRKETRGKSVSFSNNEKKPGAGEKKGREEQKKLPAAAQEETAPAKIEVVNTADLEEPGSRSIPEVDEDVIVELSYDSEKAAAESEDPIMAVEEKPVELIETE